MTPPAVHELPPHAARCHVADAKFKTCLFDFTVVTLHGADEIASLVPTSPLDRFSRFSNVSTLGPCTRANKNAQQSLSFWSSPDKGQSLLFRGSVIATPAAESYSPAIAA